MTGARTTCPQSSPGTCARDNAIYVQDSWKPSARLTINAGLRLDWIKATDALFDLDTVDDLAVGPRVGANYVITSDNTNLLRAGYGRVGDVPNSSYIGTAGTAVAGFRDEYDNDLDGIFETVLINPSSTRVSQNRRIDPDRRWPSVEEMLVGYRRQLPGQMTFDVSWISREYEHRPALVEVNGICDGSVFRGYRDESQNEIVTPVLVMHGEDDPQVPPYESAQFVAALKKHGKVHSYVTYPKEGHGFSQREHRLDAWSKQVAFPRKYLQPAYGQRVTSTTDDGTPR